MSRVATMPPANKYVDSLPLWSWQRVSRFHRFGADMETMLSLLPRADETDPAVIADRRNAYVAYLVSLGMVSAAENA